MYQKPDFVKVNVDIKENFATYDDDCEANIVTKTTMWAGQGVDCTEPMVTRVISETYAGDMRCYTWYQNV